ncbi:hypothetical protein [Jidongwangia harbinensis]|uniref:hypothetical protein n=1 Tax=Jidongwangia harbinensis TaxID=2878561 RepID=UPI001CD9971C|nr:hypothetical protein [Jidongwangia harbinensis]MCA2211930.1 hypothetical protein [Jidongwangia harbinensis]
MNPLAWGAVMEPKDWVSSGLAALALVVAVAGLSVAARSARAADRSATEAARSADAAERQAEASERQAAAAEAGIAPSGTAEEPPPVRWTLTRVGKIAYRLRNIGRAKATGVRVAGLPADAAWLVRFTGGADVAAGHSVDVTVLSVMGTAVVALEVSWGDGDSEVLPVGD